MCILPKNFQKLFLITLLALMLGECSANIDSDTPGNCSLSCADAKLAPSNARVRFLGPTDGYKSACHGIASGSDYPTTIPIQFVIEGPAAPSLPASKIEATSTDVATSTGMPLAGVSFEPLIVGGLMAANPDDPNAPPKYRGVFTSQEQWCTDSCGVGMIEIVPLCFTDNSNIVTLEVHSGNAAGNTTVTIEK